MLVRTFNSHFITTFTATYRSVLNWLKHQSLSDRYPDRPTSRTGGEKTLSKRKNYISSLRRTSDKGLEGNLSVGSRCLVPTPETFWCPLWGRVVMYKPYTLMVTTRNQTSNTNERGMADQPTGVPYGTRTKLFRSKGELPRKPRSNSTDLSGQTKPR